MSALLRVKDQTIPPMQASKWLKCPVLLNEQEMRALLNELNCGMFLTGSVISRDKEALSKEEFLNCYQQYVNLLKQGELPEDPNIRLYFSSVLTVTPEVLYTFPVSEDKHIIKVERPVIQLQLHKFDYSPIDGKFRSMVFGPNSIWWGIQFSYPQLYQDAHGVLKQVRESAEFPNTKLFKQLQKWVRQHTVATPFLIVKTQTRVNVPIRLGKQCFEWINHHPQLAEKGLQVIA